MYSRSEPFPVESTAVIAGDGSSLFAQSCIIQRISVHGAPYSIVQVYRQASMICLHDGRGATGIFNQITTFYLDE